MTIGACTYPSVLHTPTVPLHLDLFQGVDVTRLESSTLYLKCGLTRATYVFLLALLLQVYIDLLNTFKNLVVL